MIAKQVFRILHRYVKLVRPKINKYDDIFQLMKDKTQSIQSIKSINKQLQNTTKNTTKSQHLQKYYSLPKKQIQEVTRAVINSTALHPITKKQYNFSQTLSSFPKFNLSNEDIANMSHPYSDDSSALKTHYSITSPVPTNLQYEISGNVGYVFGLPYQITEKEIIDSIGAENVQSVKIQYCMLGLPASAAIKYTGDNAKKNRNIKLKNQDYEVVTEENKIKLGLDRRQLVIKGIDEYQTPASMLQQLSLYGRVMHINLPMILYKQPSVTQIKQSFKNAKNPVKLNIHNKNGTIQSEYYPHFDSSIQTKSLIQQKQQQNLKKLRYPQQINIYKDRQNQVVLKNRGFCIVTFSCQQQLQNCYLQKSNLFQMQLKNGREQFEFDDKNKYAILRYIDNCQIESIANRKPKQKQINQNQNSIFFQSLFMNIVYDKLKKQIYQNITNRSFGDYGQKRQAQLHLLYKEHLRNLKNSIGKGNVDPMEDSSKGNLYGKSFDQLAEQELYGMKISERAKKPRYQVSIDEYLQQEKPLFQKIQKKKFVKKTAVEKQLQQLNQQEQPQDGQPKEQINAAAAEAIRKYQVSLEQKAKSEAAEQAKKKLAQPVQAAKRKFSTLKPVQNYRQKTYEEIVNSHMQYNRFIRNTINQYLGVFSSEQLHQEFQSRPATYLNPQNLYFLDKTPIITEQQIEPALQKSLFPVQKYYQNLIKTNEIAKSINANVEKTIMKNLPRNKGELLHMMHDVGVVEQEFQYNGKDDIHQFVDQLNRQAAFGEEYRVSTDKRRNKKYVVKIAKMENIYPIQAVEKTKKFMSEFVQTDQFDEKKMQLLEKYTSFLQNNKPIPDQLAQAFNLQKGSIINKQDIYDQICENLNITKKDIEKMLNLNQYSDKQLKDDYERQLLILEAREKRQPAKADDYARDPADIKVKDRNRQSVVSKFRQI